jgi:hypothetical protein
MLTLSMNLPGSIRPVVALARSTRHAAALIRSFAARRGVSPLAVDWTARRLVAAR